MRVVVLSCVLLGGACGRVGFEGRELTASPDAAPDSNTTTLPCPSGTTEIEPGSIVCIESARRGSDTWTNATASCAMQLRRLCTDQEWLTACTKAAGLTDMTNNGYEWVAEQAGGIGQKRGASGCDDMSSHEIFVDPYGYRCCTER